MWYISGQIKVNFTELLLLNPKTIYCHLLPLYYESPEVVSKKNPDNGGQIPTSEHGLKQLLYSCVPSSWLTINKKSGRVVRRNLRIDIL